MLFAITLNIVHKKIHQILQEAAQLMLNSVSVRLTYVHILPCNVTADL